MDKYLLIPLDDTVVFPDMTVTLPLDVGGEARVLLVPRHEGDVREGRHGRRGRRDAAACPAAAGRDARPACTARCIGAAETGTDGRLYVEVEERPDETPPPVKTRELETEYRAVVEEILELRDADARIGEFLRSITEPGALADTCAYSPDLTFEQRVELLETLDVVERLELARAAAARAARRAAGAPAHPRRRRVRRAEAAARVLPAQADGVDPQGARRGRGLGRRRVPHEDRRGRHARRRARAGRARARPARAHGRRLRRGVDDPHATSTGCSPCRGARRPTSGSTRSSRARSSTPTTRASRT